MEKLTLLMAYLLRFRVIVFGRNNNLEGYAILYFRYRKNLLIVFLLNLESVQRMVHYVILKLLLHLPPAMGPQPLLGVFQEHVF